MEMCTNSMVQAASRRILASFAFLLFFCFSSGLLAQSNPLNRRISLDLYQQKLANALDKAGKRGHFSYSYRSDLLPLDSLINLHARDASVRSVTEMLLGPAYTFKSVGNHIVIRAQKPVPPSAPLPLAHVEGYLIDASTGQKIRFATVYDNASRGNALSDSSGHYGLQFPAGFSQAELNISRRGYYDTLIVINPSQVHQLTVGLRPYPYANQPIASREPDILEGNELEPLPLAEWLVSQNQLMLTENVAGRLHQFPFQISFVPGFGTNRILSGAIENNFSLNILAGYANGVNGLEIGGLVNIDRENVRGFQVAGLSNVVGGNVHGLQVAGLVNHVRGTVTGLQIAGIYNATPYGVKGLQIGGIGNYAKGDISHVQLGGIANLSKGNVGGFQIGGIYNHAVGNVSGFQIAGIGNWAAGNVGGFQVSGITNVSKGDVGCFQIAGINNVARGDVRGFQIGGILNQAKTVKGFQIGLINVADTVEGFCIGALNLVKHGYKVWEFGNNDVLQTNLSYKAGRSQFYNILNLGYRFGPRHFALSYGGGFGTRQLLGPLSISLEATINDVIEQGLGPGRLNLLLPQRLSLGLPLGEHLELFGGLAHNLHITNPRNAIGEFKSELNQNPLWIHDGLRTRVQGWLGYQAGLRVAL